MSNTETILKENPSLLWYALEEEILHITRQARSRLIATIAVGCFFFYTTFYTTIAAFFNFPEWFVYIVFCTTVTFAILATKRLLEKNQNIIMSQHECYKQLPEEYLQIIIDRDSKGTWGNLGSIEKILLLGFGSVAVLGFLIRVLATLIL